MLRDLDETIKNLLTKAGGFDPNQVDISFKIPNREWSEKEVQRPTLNCYLFDIHERRALREEGWRPENRKESRRQPPLFFELTYLITAWTRNIEDEHMLLWEVLETLVREGHSLKFKPSAFDGFRDLLNKYFQPATPAATAHFKDLFLSDYITERPGRVSVVTLLKSEQKHWNAVYDRLSGGPYLILDKQFLTRQFVGLVQDLTDAPILVTLVYVAQALPATTTRTARSSAIAMRTCDAPTSMPATAVMRGSAPLVVASVAPRRQHGEYTRAPRGNQREGIGIVCGLCLRIEETVRGGRGRLSAAGALLELGEHELGDGLEGVEDAGAA